MFMFSSVILHRLLIIESTDIQISKNLGIRQFLLTNLINIPEDPQHHQKFRIPLSTLAASLDNMADFPFKDPETLRYSKPTLFIRGTKSHYVADETLPVIGSFFPCFELVDVEAGHWIVSENPKAFHDGESGDAYASSCDNHMRLIWRT